MSICFQAVFLDLLWLPNPSLLWAERMKLRASSKQIQRQRPKQKVHVSSSFEELDHVNAYNQLKIEGLAQKQGVRAAHFQRVLYGGVCHRIKNLVNF